MNNLDDISRSQLNTALTRTGSVSEACASLRGALASVTDRDVTFGYRVGTLLSDATPEAVERLAGYVAPSLLARSCDAGTIRILRDAGVNPLALLLIEILLDDTTARMHLVRTPKSQGAEGIGYVELDAGGRGVDRAVVTLGSKVWWDGSKLTLPRGAVPDTVIPTLAGRRLRDVVVHPAFGHETVELVDVTNLGTIAVHTGRRPETATWLEAMGIGRREAA